MRASSLQANNNDIVKALEMAYERRRSLQLAAEQHAARCSELELAIQQLHSELEQARVMLREASSKKDRFDKLIEETEIAYSKIVESSQTLLDVLQHETQSLGEC